MNRVEKALENHKKGYNCSQAVACAFCDKTSFCEADLFRIMEGFGLGGGDMQGTCGAVAGAAAIASLLTSTGNIQVFNRSLACHFTENPAEILWRKSRCISHFFK